MTQCCDAQQQQTVSETETKNANDFSLFSLTFSKIIIIINIIIAIHKLRFMHF